MENLVVQNNQQVKKIKYKYLQAYKTFLPQVCRDAQCSAGRNCEAHIKTETYQMNNGQSTPHRFFLQDVPYHYQMKWFCHFCTLRTIRKTKHF